MESLSWLSTGRSALTNILLFRRFFPVRKTLVDALRFPLSYLGGGKTPSFPIVVDINVTNRCNQRCDFCSNRGNVVSRSDEMSLEQVLNLVHEAAQYRAGFFISGGEPFARDDVLAIIEEIRKLELPVGIVTNGTLLEGEVADAFADIGVDVAMVSAHGSAHGHDEAVGVKGARTRTMALLERLSAQLPKWSLIVNYVMSESSAADLPMLLDEVAHLPNLVVRLAHLSFLTPKEVDDHNSVWRQEFGTAPPEPLTYVLEPSRGLLRSIRNAMKDPRVRRLPARPVLNAREVESWYSPHFSLRRKCLFVWGSAVVNADGSVFPCQYYPVSMGNIQEQSLATIWESEKYTAFRRVIRKGLLPGCARCCKL